jgi:CHAD domain-containing protein
MSPRVKSPKANPAEESLTAAQPLVQSATLLLPPRFERLQVTLEQSLASRIDDPEPIHQLRVATRRCATAVDLLGGLIPSDLRRPLLRQLKKLRRVCGPARDLDIERAFYEQLLGEVDTRDLAVIDLLYERATIRRERLQPDLLDGLARRQKKLARRCADVLAHLELLRERTPDPCGHLEETALPLLTGLLQDVCDQAPGPNSSPAELHRLRIAGKKLRYACELFEPLLEPGYSSLLAPQLVAVQDELGTCHDAQVAGEQLAALRQRWKRKRLRSSWDHKPQGLFSWKELSAGLRFVARVHADRAAAARERFFELWPRFATTAFRMPLEARLRQLSSATQPGRKTPRSAKRARPKSDRSVP